MAKKPQNNNNSNNNNNSKGNNNNNNKNNKKNNNSKRNNRNGNRSTGNRNGNRKDGKPNGKEEEVSKEEGNLPQKDVTEDIPSRNTNDDEWFDKFNQSSYSGKHTFSYATGDVIRLNGYSDNSDANNLVQAGIMIFDVVNTPGVTNASSRLNELIQNQWTYIYSQQTAAGAVAGTDFFMFELALDEAYSVWAEFRRIYGLLQTYSPANRYFPKALVEGLGYNFESLKSQKILLRDLINNFGNSLKSYYVPTDISFYAMHEQMFSNIYVDIDNTRAKLYCFRKAIYRTWDDIGSEQGSRLKAVPMYSNQLLDLAGMQAICDSITQNLQQSESVAKLSSFIGKVVGNNTYILPELDEGYVVKPVTDGRRLDQIHNAFIADIFNFSEVQDGYDIEQSIDTNSLVFNPSVTINYGTAAAAKRALNIYTRERIIDTNAEDPDSKEVVHMTLFNPTFSGSVDGSKVTLNLESVTCDLLTGVRIVTFSLNASGQKTIKISKSFGTYLFESTPGEYLTYISNIGDFDRHPQFFTGIVTGTGGLMQWRITNYDNPSPFSKTDLDIMNENRNYSLYAIQMTSVGRAGNKAYKDQP